VLHRIARIGKPYLQGAYGQGAAATYPWGAQTRSALETGRFAARSNLRTPQSPTKAVGGRAWGLTSDCGQVGDARP
jgi:hypothetical protein